MGIANQMNEPDQRHGADVRRLNAVRQNRGQTRNLHIQTAPAMFRRTGLTRPINIVPIAMTQLHLIAGIVGIAFITSDIVCPGRRLGKSRQGRNGGRILSST